MNCAIWKETAMVKVTSMPPPGPGDPIFGRLHIGPPISGDVGRDADRESDDGDDPDADRPAD